MKKSIISLALSGLLFVVTPYASANSPAVGNDLERSNSSNYSLNYNGKLNVNGGTQYAYYRHGRHYGWHRGYYHRPYYHRPYYHRWHRGWYR